MEGARLSRKVAIVYVVVATLWILTSDQLLAALAPSVREYVWLATLKGCVFVAITGVMLYLLVHRGTRRLIDAERSARHSEERYRLLVRTAPDMIFTFDVEGRFLDVNPSVLAQSGYTQEELLGQPFDEFIVPEDLGHGKEHFHLSAVGTPTHYEVRYRRKDGEVRWIWCTNTPILDGGKIVGVLAIVRDVTERREREQVIAAWKNRFEVAVRTGGIVVYEWDQSIDQLLWGESLQAVLGYTPEEMGTTLDEWAERLHPDDREAVLREVRRVIDDGGEFELEYRFRHRDGSYRSLHERGGYPLDNSTPRRVLGVITDVTDRRRDEERLRRAETLAALGKLVSGVAHELNNPLSAILHFAEDLLEDPRPPADAEALGVIRQQAQRSRAIVRDLLSFVRGREERREPVAVRELVEWVVRATRPQVEGYGARLVGEAIPGDVYVEMNRAGLEQVVTNLVINAAQAVGAGGTVRLRVELGAGGKECLLVVEDDGPGIPPEVLPR
ncbi:MAG: PAS domain S-box protein, partial [Gemmatimonadetes bacterium]|nr:PAS domain S-box protein [Gemmatimonadota bacterium]